MIDFASYLISKRSIQGNKLYESLYGVDGANNAGEYLAVDNATGDIMVFTDSDSTAGGLGFLLLKPEN